MSDKPTKPSGSSDAPPTRKGIKHPDIQDIEAYRAKLDERQGRRRFNLVTLFITLILLALAALIFILPSLQQEPPVVPDPPTEPTASPPSPEPDLIDPAETPEVEDVGVDPSTLPTISADVALLMQSTPNGVDTRDDAIDLFPDADIPLFTVGAERGGFTTHVVVSGDTVSQIANTYGIEQDTIAWCNDYRIIYMIRPDDVLTIPPEDGVCHQVIAARGETAETLADEYNIDDAYKILESPYNEDFGLGDLDPDTVLPAGITVFIPGGEGRLITWTPRVIVEAGTGSSGSGSGNTSNTSGGFVTFAPGQPGSCGRTPIGGGVAWGNPLPTGRWGRGFFPGHTGLDLTAGSGTPIYAANSGYVVYAGWNTWGYGNTVVIEHGGIFSTLYAHMSQINVGCGQWVNVGEIIGLVGSTGNSSGPHLHFEIRSNNEPFNPSGTAGIGW